MADLELLQLVKRWMSPFGCCWLLLLLALGQVSSAEGSVECFICSWSPYDNRTGEWCTDKNFNAQMAKKMSCENGCEIVYSYDNNNEFEQMHRNCFTSNETLVEGCQDIRTLGYHRRQCACSADLCNGAISAFLTSGAILALLLHLAFQHGQP